MALSALEAIAILNTQNILIMTTVAGSGHPGGSLSSNRIVTYLEFAKHLDLDSFFDPDRDLYLLKGHCCPLVYSIHYLKKKIDSLLNLRELGSRLQGHFSKPHYPYVITSGGSLGHNVSIMNGIAFADRSKGLKRNYVVIVGDGELNEGQNWEAFMTIAHHKLPIKLLVDYNGLQLDGDVKKIKNIDKDGHCNLSNKLRSFGFEIEDFDQMYKSDKKDKSGNNLLWVHLVFSKLKKDSPQAVIFETTKGFGVTETAGKAEYHGKALSLDKLKLALEETEKNLEDLLNKEPSVEDVLREKLNIKIKERLKFDDAVNARKIRVEKQKPLFTEKTYCQRTAFSDLLLQLGEKYQDLFVLDADTASSTKTINFAKKFPDRFINFGISEADMLGTAAGLALGGKKVVCAGFSVFVVLKGLDQIRQDIALQNLPVYIQTSHSGLTVGEDGASHQMLEDLAIMSSLPNMNVLSFSTAKQQTSAIKRIFEGIDKKEPLYYHPTYARMHRVELPELYDDNYEFELSKNNVLKSSNEDKILIYATGPAVHFALDLYKNLLEKYKIFTRVVDVPTIKPFKINGRDIFGNGGQTTINLICTLEDGVTNGLGSQFNKAYVQLGLNVPVCNIGVDSFGESGNPRELCEKYGIMGQKLIEKIIYELMNAVAHFRLI